MLLREEAYREELIAPQELIGVAGQMDVDGDNGLCLSCVSPDGAEAAPGNGAGVELLRRARGRRRPPLLNMSVSIHAPSREAASDNAGTAKRFNHEFCRTDLVMTGTTSFSSLVKGQNVRSHLYDNLGR